LAAYTYSDKIGDNIANADDEKINDQPQITEAEAMKLINDDE
jgi:hypothetical protein